MKPDWDKLMKEYEGSSTALVADVDCTADGKSLCQKVGISGYPTIKYGDPSALEDYKGGRDFSSLQKFAKENLVPMCSPTNIDLCDDAKKKQIEELMAESSDSLASKIKEKEDEMAKVEKEFKEKVEKLQAQYQEYTTEKETKLAAVKDSGLGLMKAVKAAQAKKGGEEL
mmetsp:Transcript_32440/g.77930  ORF Transcript_32440/g.77930 Transcript_32440/m.77930 type:complete len:170 (-) Transcript_32440:221-730(-)